jgi:dTMP kinase
MTALFITIEGIDGCGKSTQAGLLFRWMKRRGLDVIKTKEPGGTRAGKRLRSLLLRGEPLSPIAELFLYLADRAEHVASVIRPALGQGRIVICERFSHSTLAYQGFGRGLDLALVRRLDSAATGGLRPDIALLLDISPAAALARVPAARRDRIEGETAGFRKRVVAGYRELARQDSRVRVVSAGDGALEVFGRVRHTIGEVLERKRGKP